MNIYMRYTFKQIHTQGNLGKCKADFDLRACKEKYGNVRMCVIRSILYVEMCWGCFGGFYSMPILSSIFKKIILCI